MEKQRKIIDTYINNNQKEDADLLGWLHTCKIKNTKASLKEAIKFILEN